MEGHTICALGDGAAWPIQVSNRQTDGRQTDGGQTDGVQAGRQTDRQTVDLFFLAPRAHLWPLPLQYIILQCRLKRNHQTVFPVPLAPYSKRRKSETDRQTDRQTDNRQTDKRSTDDFGRPNRAEFKDNWRKRFAIQLQKCNAGVFLRKTSALSGQS